MGCGASASASPVTEQRTLAVLVRGARQLPYTKGDKPDPYCVLRVGPVGSAFAEKKANAERTSKTVIDKFSPNWSFAASVPYACGEEVHVRVLDANVFWYDLLIGEARVAWSDLLAHEGTYGEFELVDEKGAPAGFVTLMGDTDSKCLETSLAEIGVAMQDDPDGGEGYWAALWQYTGAAADYLSYGLALIQNLIYGSGADGSWQWWLNLSKTRSGSIENVKIADFPEAGATTYLAHAEVASRLASLGTALGTNNADGSAKRDNYLGIQRLNNEAWPELGMKSDQMIGLAQPQETHAYVRPVLDRLLGPVKGNWTTESVRASAEAFFAGRETLLVGKGATSHVKLWVFKLLHQVHLGLDLTDDELLAFSTFQASNLILIGVPEGVVSNTVVRAALSIEKTLEQRQQYVDTYKAALQKFLPVETAALTPAQLNILASNVLDSLCFAGGQSVQTVITQTLTLLYSARGQAMLATARPNTAAPASTATSDSAAPFFDLRASDVPVFVMETIRRFPPVSVFVYSERSPPTRTFLSLQMAQRDPAAWGDDADRFVMRSLATYHQLSVGWADKAIVDGDNGAPNSRVCPGKQLSFVMICEFLNAFLRASGADAGAPLPEHAWIVDFDPKVKTRVVDWTGYGLSTSFVLRRNAS